MAGKLKRGISFENFENVTHTDAAPAAPAAGSPVAKLPRREARKTRYNTENRNKQKTATNRRHTNATPADVLVNLPPQSIRAPQGEPGGPK